MPTDDNQKTTSKFTPTQLAGHLACQHLTQLERRRLAGDLQVTFLPDPRLEGMRQRGLQHEKAYVDRLRRDGLTIKDLAQLHDPAATLAAMRQGFGAILQAPLGNEVFRGRADVLLRVEAPSSLGAYSYEPADTKLAQETKAGTILQLCTYAELLSSLQAFEPTAFHVVTPVGEEHYRTGDFAAYFRFVRARLQTASAATPPPSTYPDPVPHCDVCTYWKHCDDERRRDDHPSLVANIHTTHVRELQRQGVATLSALAARNGTLPETPKRGHVDTFLRLGHQAKLQLQARTSKLPPVEHLQAAPDHGLARLPEPSPGDVFLDFEGDPFVDAGGIEYLTGFGFIEKGGSFRYEERWALTGEEEKAACEQFIDFVMARLREYPGLHVYHFGAYEPSTLKRLCARHASRGDDLDRLLRGRRFIDLHTVVREGLRIGVERYGLKELEVLHDFVRSLDLRDAAISRRDLELALELGERHTIDHQLRAQVAAYNKDDCLSTASLRTWLENQRAQLIQRGQQVPRPVPGAAEPSEAVGDRDRRIQDLRQALTANLPEDPAARTDEEGARALLAGMLGYFRQEEKNAWWEHFRLRELPPDERLAEREMLAGLQFLELLPKEGKERNQRHLCSFPPQETSLDAGDTAYLIKAEDSVADDDKSTSLTVVELDFAAGTVVLKMSAAAAARRPTAVFRKQVVGAEILEDSLFAFAENLRDNGFATSGPFAAASELLLRRPPRLRVGGDARLRREGESTLEAAKRLCQDLDHGVLPIQGPPGSGKSHTGARAILALSLAGKRVGITAVGHKVIDNLFKKVQEAAVEAGATVRLVHKHDEDPPAGVEYLKKSDEALAAIAARSVVGGTAWLWASDAALQLLDYLFVDEAGQMSLAQVLAAARSTKNLVLLGDPQQLEQPSRGAHPEGADVAALVHVLGKDRATLHDDQGLFLDRTFRLHPRICSFTSELYYENRLSSVAGLELQEVRGATPFAGAGLFLVEVHHEGNQAQSNEEVDAVAGIVASLLQPGTMWVGKKDGERAIKPDDLLVVAPYNSQVGALRRRLLPLGVERIGTVDKFQGQEAPVVIYSCTSSSPQDAPRGMPFLYDPHRFNVATSRAEAVVIVVASPRLFEPECRTPDQMLWANGLCRYRELARSVHLAAP